MPGPGIYLPDATEGVQRIEDLPAARIIQRARNYPRRPCPKCQRSAYRLRTAQRTLHDLGDPLSGRPRDLHVTYSQHRCLHCNHYFNADMLDLASGIAGIATGRGTAGGTEERAEPLNEEDWDDSPAMIDSFSAGVYPQ